MWGSVRGWTRGPGEVAPGRHLLGGEEVVVASRESVGVPFGLTMCPTRSDACGGATFRTVPRGRRTTPRKTPVTITTSTSPSVPVPRTGTAGPTGKTRFSPIPRHTVAASVRDAIEREIRSGRLQPGTALPSEREFSEQFNVARTSVREAVQGLLTVGLVEKRGNRSFVAERLPDVRFDGHDRRKRRVRELFQVREILEVPTTRLAVCNATDEQRQRIAEVVDRFHPGMGLEEFRQLDREFHWTVVASCGNAILAELCGKVLDNLFSSEEFHELLGAAANTAAVQEVISTSVDAHRKIARAILERDPADATEQTRLHLKDVESRMVDRMH